MVTQTPRVDLFDPDFKANPYPAYARLRSEVPVHRVALPDGRGVWLVTRYEDVSAVLKDERFVKDWRVSCLNQPPSLPKVLANTSPLASS